MIRDLLGHPSDNSQKEFIAFYDAIKRIRPPDWSVQWAPRHVDIQGNEEVDKEAKKGAALDPDSDPDRTPATTLTHLRHLSKKSRKLFAEWWNRNTSASYQRWHLPAETAPKELGLAGTTLHRLFAERSGHGDFADYHRRFDHPDTAESCVCRCGEECDPGHILRYDLTQGVIRSL